MKELEIQNLQLVWSRLLTENRFQTILPTINFDEVINTVFSVGPSYYYVIDFYDMSVSNISSGFEKAHGVPSKEIQNIDNILSLIHPDDIDHVSRTEESVIRMFREIGWEKLLRYKVNYCFRFKTADGNYKLFLHQALMLTLDKDGGIGKSLNIHTDISHLTSENNYTFSLVSIDGEPSYTDIQVSPQVKILKSSSVSYSKRELEVLRLISDGCTNIEIAQKLYIAVDTVKNHRKKILEKSGTKNVAQLIKKCVLDGLI